MDDAVKIRIIADGTCFIDDEFFPVPPGASLNESVLKHLTLEAAAQEAPITADIRDEQANYHMAIQVNIDGTSRPLEPSPGRPAAASQVPAQRREPVQPPPLETSSTQSSLGSSTATASFTEPFPPERPYEALAEPHRSRMQAVLDIARKGDLSTASRAIDGLLAELVSTLGMADAGTLAAVTVQGEIAHLVGNYLYSLQLWIFLTRAWSQQLGTVHPATLRSMRNAVGCWRELAPFDALATSEDLVDLLQQIRIAGGETALWLIGQRVRQLRGK
ncbi:hypothetical protein ACEZDB_32385 [Streptacidiphilus sp. N1-3]|uniref:Uncharacterized protein n=1 Tax=Streptacidiphilus alkalitolerans TaxID=3342712 RepID=A0ABV6XAS1_9ACTN